MDDLFYSTPALNVLHKFHNNKVVVYVEGKDDRIFWGKYFEHAGANNCHFKQAGGTEALKVKINQIIDNDAEIIVACDRDHTPFTENRNIVHPRIVRTFGYSIENSIYCSITINNIISKITRKYNFDKLDEISGLFSDISESVAELLIYDVANYKFNKGVKIFGDTPNRFMTNNKSININARKANEFIGTIKNRFTTEEINYIKDKLKTETREVWFLIKGHFLTNLVINIVKRICFVETGKKHTMSSDNFYSLVIDGCSICNFKCTKCQTITSDIQNAMASI